MQREVVATSCLSVPSYNGFPTKIVAEGTSGGLLRAKTEFHHATGSVPSFGFFRVLRSIHSSVPVCRAFPFKRSLAAIILPSCRFSLSPYTLCWPVYWNVNCSIERMPVLIPFTLCFATFRHNALPNALCWPMYWNADRSLEQRAALMKRCY